MEKILITGSNSFIAKSILAKLQNNYNIVSLTKQELDITNFNKLKEVLNNIDCVIHCGNKGGRRIRQGLPQDSSQDTYENLLMLENLLYFQDKYEKLILFSSGAEFNSEIPTSYYGLSKYIQTQRVKNNNKIINLRLYNVFSEYGMKDSFIHTVIRNCLENKDIEIWENKNFDSFYGEDLAILINYLIQNISENYLEIDCVYKNKIKLSDIANMIKILTKSQSNIIIHQETGKSYHGNGDKLYNLGLDSIGLKRGILNCIEYIKNNKPKN